MLNSSFSVVEIKSVRDPLFLSWLDLYETSFPFNERVLVSYLLKSLEQIEQGQDSDTHYLALVDIQNNFLGMMLYQTASPETEAAWLWYIAIKASEQSKGLGQILYRELIHRLDTSKIRLLVFEVEIPEGENAEIARRRIRFYQRQGALLLEGIEYIQEIGWHSPPTPMHLMVHPLQPLNVEQAYALAKGVFGDALAQIGELRYSQL